ncbi:HupE/UreJ family protein [Litoreibacter arenae]|uniref:Membrane protein n=1 Tax=Litoreibacter arenae DSM 19593 TaxID=1123360 RepID=S9QC01_9RHOB|nr:HupE/UreJ family protein [Litoreibacter arenae]EPX77487.1 Membrane protein [Litoreibacter arenae DSM 19593]
MKNPLRNLLTMLGQVAVLSMLAMFTMASATSAHEIRPAIADVALSDDRIEMTIRLTAEPLVAGIDLEGLQDTNESPEAEQYDALRALPPAELATRLRETWPDIADSLTVFAGDTPVSLDLMDVSVAEQPNLELPRDTTVTLSGALPADGSDIRAGWQAANGPIIIRQAEGGEDAYAGYLEGGALSEPLPRAGAASESAMSVFVRYIGVGFDHIIPKGLDHILFVLGLFFLSLHLRPLIVQVTVFTVAHTVTLALASLGYVSVNPAIVEPLIALSIVYVAVENIFTSRITWWRPIVIFAFGLLHGLGFASVLDEFGLAPGRFVAGLIGFNVGVEVGQLTVIALAYLAVGYWFGKKPWYRARIAIPASVFIAIVGAYWAIERVFL